ncbi:hypothetical protein DWG95_17130 [Escherichia coli]|nr:hypothetical protein C1192_11695 [Escherichia marmotae]EFO1362397.1 hypothetical protein [Escherichia coli]
MSHQFNLNLKILNVFLVLIKDGDSEKARNVIGKIYGNGEVTSARGQSYYGYYGDGYDLNYDNQ